MVKRSKYCSFTVVTDTDSCCFEKYINAFKAFYKSSCSATLWGETHQGDIVVIKSKTI